MRLIQGVLRPAKIGLFQWRQVIKTSIVSLRPVLIQTSNPVHGSDMKWRGRSCAASATSDPLEARKPRKRVSKDERKSMVENYVNKYRAMNGGKFPTVSDARKDLGGSYYVTRQIIQELKYNYKISSTGSTFGKASLKKDEISTDFGEVSQTRISNTSSKSSSKSMEGPQSSITFKENVNGKTKPRKGLHFNIEKTEKSKDVGTQSDHPISEPKSSLPSDPETNTKQETQPGDKLPLEESTQSEMPRRELHKVPIEDAKPQRKSSVWHNLKSFANDMFDIWRKS